ncbi:hypothetical protein HMI54_011429 [Coelomomyces lativittatus]|nr:hypothetical protein HMI54_011429 [Coelomomyces lativittatus]
MLTHASMHIQPFLDNVHQSLLQLLSLHASSNGTETIRNLLQRLLNQLQTLPSSTSPPPSSTRTLSPSPKSYSLSNTLTYFLDLPSNLPNPSHLIELQSWNFNVFSYSHAELVLFLLELFLDLDLLYPFQISTKNFYEFLMSVEKGYSIHLNPYHHFRHAFDVTQCVYIFLKAFPANSKPSKGSKKQSNSSKSSSRDTPTSDTSLSTSTPQFPFLTKEEQFALLLACVCHDLEHDGKTNQFHIKTESELAIAYNDQSPLENHHTRTCFKLLQHHHLLDTFTGSLRTQFRSLIIQCILATDMSKHSDILQRFQGLSFTWSDAHHRSKLLEMLIKCADVSNVLRPLTLAKQWADAIQEEMFRMGDIEKLLNLNISLFCDRSKPQPALLGKSFCENLCSPMFQHVTHVVPSLQPYFNSIKETQGYWNSVLQEK